MGIKKIWNRLFNRKNDNILTAEEPNIETTEEYVVPTLFNYGLDMMPFALRSGDYGWSEPKPFKKVILVNPLECEDKITLMGMVSAWNGTGHFEWEILLAGWFVTAVVNAVNTEQNEADITKLFDRDLLAHNGMVLTQEQIYKHIIPWFEIVDENDIELKLKLKLA